MEQHRCDHRTFGWPPLDAERLWGAISIDRAQAVQSLHKKPLGTDGGHRRRLLLHPAPLAVASALVTAMLMSFRNYPETSLTGNTSIVFADRRGTPTLSRFDDRNLTAPPRTTQPDIDRVARRYAWHIGKRCSRRGAPDIAPSPARRGAQTHALSHRPANPQILRC